MIGRLAFRAAAAGTVALAGPALAGEAVQVPHGMTVTTDTGLKVRVQGFADRTFRVTVAADPSAAPLSPTVVEQADGELDFRSNTETASFAMQQGSAGR